MKYIQVHLEKKIKDSWHYRTLWVPSEKVKIGREIEDGWKIAEIYSGVSADMIKRYPKEFKTKLS